MKRHTKQAASLCTGFLFVGIIVGAVLGWMARGVAP